MNDELFSDLVQSIKEMQAIEKNELKAARTTIVAIPNTKAIREKLGLSQTDFASLIDVSKHTLISWEQGKRNPSGPARTLLLIAQEHPEVVFKTIKSTKNTTEIR